MKRFYLILLALTGSIALGSCEEKLELETHVEITVGGGEIAPYEDDYLFGFEEIMPLGGQLSTAAQGGDCWGDYFFQFTTNNTKVRVFDLSLKTLVQTITIPTTERGFVSNCHCNTVCFGTEYYDVDDVFPLLYVSTGYASDGYTGALVYRITQHSGIFFITLVQTLKFPETQSSWTEFVPAGDHAYLCYTTERIIYKVKMPKLKDGDTVIDPESALETYQFTPQPDWMSSSRNQDRLFHQGKLLYITGVPQSREASAFVILDLEKRERERIVDFQKNGLMDESESLFVWQGELCVAFLDKIVRLIL